MDCWRRGNHERIENTDRSSTTQGFLYWEVSSCLIALLLCGMTRVSSVNCTRYSTWKFRTLKTADSHSEGLDVRQSARKLKGGSLNMTCIVRLYVISQHLCYLPTLWKGPVYHGGVYAFQQRLPR